MLSATVSKRLEALPDISKQGKRIRHSSTMETKEDEHREPDSLKSERPVRRGGHAIPTGPTVPTLHAESHPARP
jgi:hypothetical protein